MPPIVRFNREGVLDAAYALVRREGAGALNARAVARELGGSTQPIFRLFTGMDDLYAQIIRKADEELRSRMARQIREGRNEYVSVCMTYLLFARDEPELFKLLFMRDRVKAGDVGREYTHEWGFPVIERSFGVNRDTAVRLYEQTFFHTHGLAVCFATKYMPCLSEECMERHVTENLRAAAAHLGVHLEDV